MTTPAQPSRTPPTPATTAPVASNIRVHAADIASHERAARLGVGATVWFTGLSGAGKSTIAAGLEARLIRRGRFAYWLDGDNLRHGLNSDLGFSDADRAENVRRVAEVSGLFAQSGAIALVSVISPFEAGRRHAREVHARTGAVFLEVFVHADMTALEARDPKGLYRRARAGEIRGLTGVDAPYEAPAAPDLAIRTDQCTIEAAIERVEDLLSARGVLSTPGSTPSTPNPHHSSRTTP